MSAFSDAALGAINRYKMILRKTLLSPEKTALFLHLGIKRKQLQQVSETSLYRTTYRVMQDVETRRRPDEPCWYCGLDECLQHLKDLLGEYRIEGNAVVNVKQVASRAIVEAVQLIAAAASGGRVPAQQHERFDRCLQLVKKYGTAEQQAVLKKALQARADARVPTDTVRDRRAICT